MAVVGDRLTSPEIGWKRIDLNKSIAGLNFSSSWNDNVYEANSYNSNCMTAGDGQTLSFFVKSKKIRFLCFCNSVKGDAHKIEVNGEASTFSTKIYNGGQIISYENLSLGDGISEIKITVDYDMTLDCIDIDSDGYISCKTEHSLTEKSSLEEMEIGDIIPCRYTAPITGRVGFFSELGTCETDYINPQTSSATPDGKFYFIKVDDNKFIADRNVQHSISWNELNSNKIIEGSNCTYLVPILSSNTSNGMNVTSSSTYSSSFEPFKLFTRSGEDSRWVSETGTKNAIVTVEFPGKVFVNKISMKAVNSPETTYGTVCSPGNFKIEASDNGTSWVTLKEENLDVSYYENNNYTYIGYLDDTTAYKMYRLNILSTAGDSAAYIDLRQTDFIYEHRIEGATINIPTGGVAYNCKRTFPLIPMDSDENEYAKIAVSKVYSSRPGYRVFDMYNPANSTGGHWYFSGSTGWLKIEFKTDVYFDTINVHKDNSTQNHYPFSTVKVEGSDDDSSWYIIQDTKTAETGPFAKTVCNSINGVVKYKYVKFTFTGGSYNKVGEIEFFNNSSDNTNAYHLYHQNQGGWPVINDWDKYVCKSNLNEKINFGDKDIWNYEKVSSICKDKVLPDIKHIDDTAPSIPSSNSMIVERGCVDSYIDDTSPKRFDVRATSDVRSTTGFRPMLVTGGGN